MPRHRQGFPRPSHFSVKDDGSTLRIRFRWIWRNFTKAAGICLFWNSGLFVWYWSAVHEPNERIMWFVLIWTIPFVAVGLLLIYATLAGLLNRTVITVTSLIFTVRHGPVPWWGNLTFPIDDLEGLYCDEDASVKRKGRGPSSVVALTKGGSKVELVTDFD